MSRWFRWWMTHHLKRAMKWAASDDDTQVYYVLEELLKDVQRVRSSPSGRPSGGADPPK